MTDQETKDKATQFRSRRAFLWLPALCNDGRWRWFDIVRVEEYLSHGRWYRVGVIPVAS